MRHIIAHGHIFKNAGSTFDWSLQRGFGEAFLDHRDDQTMRQQKAKEVARIVADSGAIKAFSSHHLHSELPSVEGVVFAPVYLIRHPIARLASVYRFERKQDAQTPGARMAKELSFKEYVRWRLEPETPPTIKNYQCRYLAGMLTMRNERVVGPVRFDAALATLRNTRCVGIVEDYDRSMVMFEASLKPNFPELDLAYVIQNTTQTAETTFDDKIAAVLDELDDLAPTVLRANTFDLALYEYAVGLLQHRFAALSDGESRLTEFRSRCDALHS